jgi:hypothetical protein
MLVLAHRRQTNAGAVRRAIQILVDHIQVHHLFASVQVPPRHLLTCIMAWAYHAAHAGPECSAEVMLGHAWGTPCMACMRAVQALMHSVAFALLMSCASCAGGMLQQHRYGPMPIMCIMPTAAWRTFSLHMAILHSQGGQSGQRCGSMLGMALI